MNVNAGDFFEARVIGFPPNLALGRVGVTILDNEGNITSARSASPIEDPVGSGSYVTTLQAPVIAGDYTLYWDFVGMTAIQAGWEDLVVGSVGPFSGSTGTGGVRGTSAVGAAIKEGVRVPHFDLPFRFGLDGHAAVVEQDTVADVINCVSAIVRTPLGSRYDNPDFGIADPTFSRIPLDDHAIVEAVVRQEPRAFAQVDQAPDPYNALAQIIRLNVSTKDPGEVSGV